MPINCPVPLGEIFAGKYRVDRVLGEGGMGIVVAAHHLELDQTVAIKFLLDGGTGSKEGGERFRREARAAAKIQSDHVVRVLDVGLLDSGERYMVMEYMHGRDLTEELREQGTFTVPVATGFMLEALDAVAHAHSVGIVHRDLKPANLFLARRPDGTARVKVLDFGISKTVGAGSASDLSLTKTSAWMGSPLYMSPEQMQSARDVDHRADIWSLGAIYYELLTGQPPYVADSLPQLCSMLLTTDPIDIRRLQPAVPDELAGVIMSCLSRNLETRIQDAGQLAEAIRPFAAAGARMGRTPLFLDRTEMGPGPPMATEARRSAVGQVSSETVSGHSASVAGAPVERRRIGWMLGGAALVAGAIALAYFSWGGASATQGAASNPSLVPETSRPAVEPDDSAAENPARAPASGAVATPTPAATEATVQVGSGSSASGSGGLSGASPSASRPASALIKKPKPVPPARPTPSPESGTPDFGGRR